MIPVNIITGALGVGKTTALRHLLSQRPPNERWAIVVNEFGALGIDGAILDTAGGMTRRPGPRAGGGGDDGGASEPVAAAAADDDDDDDGMVVVREVAGGCLCCAVAAPFTVAVTQVLRRARPDRLFIEPSGMGHPGGLFDALSNEHLRGVLALRATIALVDVREVATRGEVFRSDAFVDQVQCADVVVGAKARSIHWSPYDRVGVVNADP
jgi:G3E family GTPase